MASFSDEDARKWQARVDTLTADITRAQGEISELKKKLDAWKVLTGQEEISATVSFASSLIQKLDSLLPGDPTVKDRIEAVITAQYPSMLTPLQVKELVQQSWPDESIGSTNYLYTALRRLAADNRILSVDGRYQANPARLKITPSGS